MKLKKVFILFLFILLSSCNNYSVKPKFSEAYIKEYSGRSVVEISKTIELFHIVLSLTKIGNIDKYMLNKNTDYYQKVLNHFSTFKNETIVSKLNTKLSKSPHSYHKFVKFLYNFQFKGNTIIEKEEYDVQSSYDKYISLLETFALKSNFLDFFNKNEMYYSELIDMQKSIVPVREMQQWLETEFSNKYQCYKTVFSPLTGGNHSTINFSDNNYSEMVLFISAPKINTTPEKRKIYSGLLSGIVFTEIDHNYVNPISKQHEKDIQEALSNRSNWIIDNSITKNYKSEYEVFNEYMTHALFCIYILEKFQSKEAKIIIDNRIKLMNELRGFYRFKEFTEYLIILREINPNKSIKDLYQEIINWFNTKN